MLSPVGALVPHSGRPLMTSRSETSRLSDDYENNLTEPQQKVREDVEKEWRPRVEALEAKAAEKEKFYRELYDSVQTLRGENARLKTVSRRPISLASLQTLTLICEDLRALDRREETILGSAPRARGSTRRYDRSALSMGGQGFARRAGTDACAARARGRS